MVLEIKPTAEGIEPEVLRPGLFISEPTQRALGLRVTLQLVGSHQTQPGYRRSVQNAVDAIALRQLHTDYICVGGREHGDGFLV